MLKTETNTARREQIQNEALARAEQGQSVMNYGPIFEGFTAMGIPIEEILPRENVFTFNAWKAKGRYVRKGQHGVRCVTWVTSSKQNKETGEQESRRFCTSTTVFHISQTEAQSV
jgi:hypothetical protein